MLGAVTISSEVELLGGRGHSVAPVRSGFFEHRLLLSISQTITDTKGIQRLVLNVNPHILTTLMRADPLTPTIECVPTCETTRTDYKDPGFVSGNSFLFVGIWKRKMNCFCVSTHVPSSLSVL